MRGSLRQDAFDERVRIRERPIDDRFDVSLARANREDRTREIGRMLSGDHVTPEALQHAEQLMQAGAKS